MSTANYKAQVALQHQAPVYVLTIDGVTAEYGTAEGLSAVDGGSAPTNLMSLPKGGGGAVDMLEGTTTLSEVTCTLLDVAGAITTLVSTDASGAPVSTLINRDAILWGGYRGLAAGDFAKIFVGQISGVKMTRDMTGYEIRLSDKTILLGNDIMTAATDTLPATIRGNVVNVYWSILTGTFDIGHATFPLDSVSTLTGSSSAPTGLGIATADIDETLLVSERDRWHSTDVVEVVFTEPEDGKQHLEAEFFRTFQCFPAIGTDGTLGLRFITPPAPSAAAVVMDEDTIVSVSGWDRPFSNHLNKFVFKGDFNTATDVYDADLYVASTSEDTTDRTATNETVEYLVESRWLQSAYDGAAIAKELAGRLRLRYLKPPAEMTVRSAFIKRELAAGDVIALTYRQIPDLRLGTRGVTSRLMTVVSVSSDYAKGLMKFKLVDSGLRKYGVVGPAAQTVYGSATDIQKDTYCWVGATSTNYVGSSEEGYRLI